jgi:hypothetical protein
VPQHRRPPRTYPVKGKHPEWSEYTSYEHIVKRWKELDSKAKHAERVLRYWQIAAGTGWTTALILLLVVIAQ